ncbi:MAG: ROK family transcriptional regulator [Spirochaetales bacterium]|nr:ROK family transcriptional regulator [Spirochaetales bacterium]
MLEKYKSIQKDRMAAILNEVLSARQITRGELGRRLSLSPSSVVKYLKELIELGLVRESGAEETSGGRRRTFLEFDPHVGVNISVIFNLSSLEGALINPAGETLFRTSMEVFNQIPSEILLNKLDELIENLVKQAKAIGKRIFGIGVGIGDYLDMEQGISHYYERAAGWKEINLKERYEAIHGYPFFLINDIDSGALGEKYYGMGVGLSNFVCVWVAETVGMGIVLNGDIYLAKNGFVGEIGHTRSVENGTLCVCGNTGCLETVINEEYVIGRCREGLSSGVKSSVLDLCGGDVQNLDIESIIEASNRGDRFCRNIFGETARFLGDKLTEVANILNPELISLRGPVIQNNFFLVENVERIIKNQALNPICNEIRIEAAPYEGDIRLSGISSYILSKYFKQEIL